MYLKIHFFNTLLSLSVLGNVSDSKEINSLFLAFCQYMSPMTTWVLQKILGILSDLCEVKHRIDTANIVSQIFYTDNQLLKAPNESCVCWTVICLYLYSMLILVLLEKYKRYGIARFYSISITSLEESPSCFWKHL